MIPRVAILTVSDRSSRGERPDTSGPALEAEILAQNWQVTTYAIVPDERDAIASQLAAWCDAAAADVILTTGGTGLALRDVTPEATLAVMDRSAPGIAEAIRAESMKITPHAMLSRGVTVIRGRTLIVNLPGSPKGAVECLRVILPILPHAVETLRDEPTTEQGHNKI